MRKITEILLLLLSKYFYRNSTASPRGLVIVAISILLLVYLPPIPVLRKLCFPSRGQTRSIPQLLLWLRGGETQKTTFQFGDHDFIFNHRDGVEPSFGGHFVMDRVLDVQRQSALAGANAGDRGLFFSSFLSDVFVQSARLGLRKHIVFLQDTERLEFYRDALELHAKSASHGLCDDKCRNVASSERPSCRNIRLILDLGSGTGVLSILAARAFPQALVVAIEANEGVASLSRSAFVENNVADRVFLLSGKLSTDIATESLIEAVRRRWKKTKKEFAGFDLIVTEIFGAMLFGEMAHLSLADALHRWGHKDTIVVPGHGCQFGRLVGSTMNMTTPEQPDSDSEMTSAWKLQPLFPPYQADPAAAIVVLTKNEHQVGGSHDFAGNEDRLVFFSERTCVLNKDFRTLAHGPLTFVAEEQRIGDAFTTTYTSLDRLILEASIKVVSIQWGRTRRGHSSHLALADEDQKVNGALHRSCGWLSGILFDWRIEASTTLKTSPDILNNGTGDQKAPVVPHNQNDPRFTMGMDTSPGARNVAGQIAWSPLILRLPKTRACEGDLVDFLVDAVSGKPFSLRLRRRRANRGLDQEGLKQESRRNNPKNTSMRYAEDLFSQSQSHQQQYYDTDGFESIDLLAGKTVRNQAKRHSRKSTQQQESLLPKMQSGEVLPGLHLSALFQAAQTLELVS
ncbi:unnamed protein product [Amoebophrya sp. A25]|nr:unnamed protein product [Amoebophrya sp. A25]|eukprot:GSA25T00005351001.1